MYAAARFIADSDAFAIMLSSLGSSPAGFNAR
jgi:hypothetical protein